MEITWEDTKPVSKVLHFDDLPLNATFRNTSRLSQGAVYAKVATQYDDNYMMEIQTGRLFPPTASPVEIVNVNVKIPLPKPSLY